MSSLDVVQRPQVLRTRPCIAIGKLPWVVVRNRLSNDFQHHACASNVKNPRVFRPSDAMAASRKRLAYREKVLED